MLPSRGLRLSNQAIGAGRRRLNVATTRSFSSTLAQNGLPKSTLQLSKSGALSSKTFSRPRVLLVSSMLRNGSAMRFQSTKPVVIGTSSPTSQISETTKITPEWAPEAVSSSLDTPLDNVVDLSSTSLLGMEEQIGYLKALGLDYGYGPTSVMEWVLEHIHVLSGTPWWASIALMAIAIRAVFFKAYIGAADNSARMATVKHVTQPLTDKMREHQKNGDTVQMMAARREIQIIHRRAGIKMWKSFVPLVQVFAGYGSFVLLRGMANIPVPGLETGGLLWFTNLALPDPFYLLPIISSGILHYLLRKGGETGVNTMSKSVAKSLAYIFPALSLLFTSFMPAALQLYFFVSIILSAIQATLFRASGFRKIAGMFPLTKSSDPFAPDDPKSPPQRFTRAPSAPSPTDPTYQAPRSITNTESAPPAPAVNAKPTILSNLTKEVKTAASSVSDFGANVVKSAKEYAGAERKDGKRSKAELREAEAYEKKRQKEEAEHAARERERRISQRRARKTEL